MVGFDDENVYFVDMFVDVLWVMVEVGELGELVVWGEEIVVGFGGEEEINGVLCVVWYGEIFDF